jgi:hypothetical protein
VLAGLPRDTGFRAGRSTRAIPAFTFRCSENLLMSLAQDVRRALLAAFEHPSSPPFLESSTIRIPFGVGDSDEEMRAVGEIVVDVVLLRAVVRERLFQKHSALLQKIVNPFLKFPDKNLPAPVFEDTVQRLVRVADAIVDAATATTPVRMRLDRAVETAIDQGIHDVRQMRICPCPRGEPFVATPQRKRFFSAVCEREFKQAEQPRNRGGQHAYTYRRNKAADALNSADDSAIEGSPSSDSMLKVGAKHAALADTDHAYWNQIVFLSQTNPAVGKAVRAYRRVTTESKSRFRIRR